MIDDAIATGRSKVASLLHLLRRGGARAAAARAVSRLLGMKPSYAVWHRCFQALSAADRRVIHARAQGMTTRFVVLLRSSGVTPDELSRAVAAVRRQLYPHWRLLLAGDHSGALDALAGGDARIAVVPQDHPRALNEALAGATDDFALLADAAGELAEHALYALALRAPQADVVYGDQDFAGERGEPREPQFKPDWNPDLLLSCNYIGEPCAVRRSLLCAVGGLRDLPPRAQAYDAVLRASAQATSIEHAPFVLYRGRRSAMGGGTRNSAAAAQAVQEHVGAPASVGDAPLAGTHRLRWRIPQPGPLVSLIVPTRDGGTVLEACVASILEKTEYRNFELLVVDNQSRSPRTLALLRDLAGSGRARVLSFDAPFNFSAINNRAASEARGTVLGLLNDDLQVLDGGWLEELVSQAMRPGIGAVGARLLYPDLTVQHGGIVLGVAGAAGHAHKHAPAADPGYCGRAQVVQDMSAVTAACLFVRADTFARAGGLDESLAVAFNDVDFCLRLLRLGLRNVWTPFATLIHHESSSRGGDESPEKRRRLEAERGVLLSRWGELLRNDPAYNPNLTLESEDFALAWPPRARRPWRQR
jgi:GT2 family glycosyltransferase